MYQKAKKPIYKKWWFWLLVFLFLLVMGNLNTTTKTEAPTQEEQPPIEEKTASETKELSLIDQVTAIVEDPSIGATDVKVVQGVPDADRFKITFTPKDSSWDDTGFVSDCLSDYIDICSKAYQLDGVNKIELYVFVDFIDSKGNVNQEKGFSMCMPKKNFDTYTWENLKYTKGIYNTLINDCELWTVHAGIEKNVNYDDVRYK